MSGSQAVLDIRSPRRLGCLTWWLRVAGHVHLLVALFARPGRLHRSLLSARAQSTACRPLSEYITGNCREQRTYLFTAEFFDNAENSKGGSKFLLLPRPRTCGQCERRTFRRAHEPRARLRRSHRDSPETPPRRHRPGILPPPPHRGISRSSLSLRIVCLLTGALFQVSRSRCRQ